MKKGFSVRTMGMIPRFSLLFALMLITTLAFSQAKIVSGNVVDSASGDPVAGASVRVQGLNTGISTNSDGSFKIAVRQGGILEVSNVGYKTVTIPAEFGEPMRIVLPAVDKQLADVVVVGYGTQKRSDITGSVASVPTARLSQLPNTNAFQAMEGSVAGVNITQTSSVPGGAVTALVRGVNSISANTDPFIVLDGIPFSTTGGSINDINPSDIASIEILKDASAVAIYGTRGANGVILITTKKGKTGKASISYDGYAGVEGYSHILEPMGPDAYVQKYADWKEQVGNTDPNPLPNAFEIQNLADGKITNWRQAVSQPGNLQNHSLNVSGGSRDVHYYISGNYFKENGVIKGYQYNRASIRSNVSANITDYLTAGFNLYLAANNFDGGHADLTHAMTISPYGSLYNEDGSYAIYPMFGELLYTNPLLGLKTINNNRTKNINTSFYAEVKPAFLKGLKYRINASYGYVPTLIQTYAGRAANNLTGRAEVDNTTTKNWLIENILSYQLDLNRSHIDLTGLYSAQETNYFSSGVVSSGFINDVLTFDNLAAGATQSGTSSAYKTDLLSQMIRVNYSYDNRYLLTVTARRDGYSAFGANTSKYGVFPSAALGWNIQNENFMKNARFVNNLKLRLSYGLSGNQAIAANATSSVSNTASLTYNGLTTIGVVSSALGNGNLEWESTYGANLGIDYGLFNNRVSGSIEFYDTRTKSLLLDRSLPTVSGYNQVLDNLGKLANKGFEFSVRTENIRNGKFKWETSLNFSAIQNKIVSLYGDKKDDIGNRWFIGHPVNVVYDYQLIGVWQEGEENAHLDPIAKPGDLKFADLNGDGQISEADKKILGQSNPTWFGGITNTFHYGDFHLNIFIQTVQGVSKSNPLMDWWDLAGRQNVAANVGYWTAANKSNSRPSLAYTNFRTYGYMQDASFTRLKDVTLSYTASQKILNATKLGGLTIYVSGRNLATLTKWKGWDPESDYNKAHNAGFHDSNSTYPLVRTIIFGLNITLR
jgi:TonB-linked SusC/RagA family outer membrane protein